MNNDSYNTQIRNLLPALQDYSGIPGMNLRSSALLHAHRAFRERVAEQQFAVEPVGSGLSLLVVARSSDHDIDEFHLGYLQRFASGVIVYKPTVSVGPELSVVVRSSHDSFRFVRNTLDANQWEISSGSLVKGIPGCQHHLFWFDAREGNIVYGIHPLRWSFMRKWLDYWLPSDIIYR